MDSRRLPTPLVALFAAVVVTALVSPAAGASTTTAKPSAKAMLAKSLAGAKATKRRSGLSALAEDPGEEDGDEAESVKLRGEFLQSITAAPAVSAPADGLVAAAKAGAALPTAAGAWQEVTNKPFIDDPINRGDNFGVGWYNVTGRMTALTSSGNTVYAGAASGGVWRSTDKGLHWREVNAGLARIAIGALATDPTDGSIWAGTGEANNASENQYGVGVYRLAKGSDTWHQVGGSELYGSGVYRISWIGGFVYAATSHGLYRRTAGSSAGTAWQVVLQPAGNVAYPPSSSVTDIIAVPGTNGRKILAVVGWAGYSDPPAVDNNGFYVGTGAPGSFARVTPTGDIDPTRIGRTSFSSSRRLALRHRPGHPDRRPRRRGRLRVEVREPDRSVDQDRRHRQAGRIRLGAR